MASIIEREVNREEYRAKVARVIYNRLAKDMKLELDSTVIYAREPEDDHHHRRRTGRAGRRTTPTGTRDCRPGRSPRPARRRLQAAAQPENGKWLYFVTVNFDTGETKFANTKAELEKNARSSRPGARPTRAAVTADGATPLRRPGFADRPLAVPARCTGRRTRPWAWTGATSASRCPPTGLADFVAGLDASWRGLSLTMPLKEAVLELGEVDPVARLAGGGNTLILRRPAPGLQHRRGRAGLGGPPSDAGPVPRVTILGSGATARSAVVALSQLAARDGHGRRADPGQGRGPGRARHRAGLRMRVQPWGSVPPPADLVLSAATAGAADSMAEPIAASAPVVLDIVYAPWPTPLAQAAAQAGRTVISGLDLLVGQALRQVELMTGQSVPAEVLYAALPESRGSLAGT